MQHRIQEAYRSGYLSSLALMKRARRIPTDEDTPAIEQIASSNAKRYAVYNQPIQDLTLTILTVAIIFTAGMLTAVLLFS